jgi:toxin ParE1/3/4
MSRVTLKPAAEKDISHLVHYFFSRSVETASRFYSAVEDAGKQLAESPELGQRIASPSERIANIRVWAIPGFRNHLIFYRPLDDGVEIVRILHGARDWLAIIESSSDL